jgi:hypothetical protein
MDGVSAHFPEGGAIPRGSNRLVEPRDLVAQSGG